MNIFCGCDPDALAELAERLHERALRLRELIELLRATAEAVTWVGPDADAHRRRTAAMADAALAVAADLRAAALAARRHAWEQECASQVDPGAAVRAELPGGEFVERLRRPGVLDDPGPWIGGPFQAGDPRDPFPPLPPVPEPPGGWGPLIGGPMAPTDPLDLLPDGSTPPSPPGGWGPWSGGPFLPTSAPSLRPRGLEPGGDELALDPEIVAGAQEDRRSVLGAIPVAGTIQTAMDMHGGLGEIHDGVDRALADAGLEQLQPLADLSRIPHRLTEPVLGEDSRLGQVADIADRSWANVLQTGSEVTGAVGEGDWGGAAAAAERGMFRSAGTSAELLSTSAIPAYAETGADLLGDGADALRPVSPEAAEGLEDLSGGLRGRGEEYEAFLDSYSDAESWYATRREHAPMPWDPQE
jgi:hypothetical protein